ncbi:unnamed protein product [Ranitomeya imitator]|uniref:Uncharacterized protein n=1 Tax=Ranitomeya imitator TaxID=111125 RepID=A0ABN9LW97_9NEOB|nr:unnamed protein product [Ranitomeya imitator]
MNETLVPCTQRCTRCHHSHSPLYLQMSNVCAVFGGSRGIGKAVAKLLVQRDYKVVVISRNLDVAKATTEEIGGQYL